MIASTSKKGDNYMAILSASRRTDIPTYYGKWFMNRLREGSFMTRNSYNQKLSKYNFTKDDIDCIVFWTKNPIPFLQYVPELQAYPHYFQFTLTGYDRDLEAGLPDKEKLLEAFSNLYQMGSHIIWRYDPIVFTDKYTADWHINTFRKYAETLQGKTDRCVISFVDLYNHLGSNSGMQTPLNQSDFDLNQFAKTISDIARENGMQVYTCAEIVDLSFCGIQKGKCIDPDYIEKITGKTIELGKDKAQRKECGCIESIEMGAYNTCHNGCKYCYACPNKALTDTCLTRYDVNSPILCDKVEPYETFTEHRLKAFAKPKYEQLSFFQLFT